MTASDLIKVQESHVRRSSQEGMLSSLVEGGGTNLMLCVFEDDSSVLEKLEKLKNSVSRNFEFTFC